VLSSGGTEGGITDGFEERDRARDLARDQLEAWGGGGQWQWAAQGAWPLKTGEVGWRRVGPGHSAGRRGSNNIQIDFKLI
jgi:hypothetical protein